LIEYRRGLNPWAVEKLIARFERAFKPVVGAKGTLADVDVVFSKKKGWSGLALTESILVLDTRQMYSFRAQLQNLDTVQPIMGMKRLSPVDKPNLEAYFAENRDNPFAVALALRVLGQQIDFQPLTQLPPLSYKKVDSAFGVILEQAEFGDAIFTLDGESALSRLIRRVDRSQWSHVASVSGPGRIVEVTTSGIHETDLATIYTPSLDVGLYRLKAGLTAEQKATMRALMDLMLAQRVHFSWAKALRIYLARRWRLPIKHPPTPSDLICANNLRLVAYA